MKVLNTKGSGGENRNLLDALNQAGCPFLVIGGLAVHHYAQEREYDDLDLWVLTSLDTVDRLRKVLGLFPSDFSPSELDKCALHLPMKHIQAKRSLYVDILTVDEAEFNTAYSDAVEAKCDGCIVKIAPVQTLLLLAQKSSNEKHRGDVTLLKRLLV